MVAGGWSGPALEEVDDRLAGRRYPRLAGQVHSATLGGYRTLGRGILIGAEWNGLLIGQGTGAGGRGVGMGGGYATVAVGLATDISPRIRILRRLGFGLGGIGLWFEGEDSPEQPTEIRFDEVLENPDRFLMPGNEPLTLSRDGVVIDLGVEMEVAVRPAGRSPVLGIRVGYLAEPWPGSWHLKGAEVIDAPAASIDGPYLRIFTGLGGRG